MNKKKLLLCYLYTKNNLDSIDNIIKYQNEFNNIIIINISDEELEINNSEIKIYNSDKENYLIQLSEIAQAKKLHSDYILILENDEKFISDIKSLTLDEDYYNISIIPEKPETSDFDIEPFSTTEIRLISLKAKDLKEFFQKGDFYFDNSKKSISKNQIYITKKNIDVDFEILKASVFNKKENLSFRDKFYFATSFFYKNSILVEEKYTEIIENNDATNNYRADSLVMLMKLLNRKQEFDRVVDLAEKFHEFSNFKAFNVYYAIATFEKWNFVQAIKIFHKAIKQENQLILYNNSDLNWRLFNYLGNIFYRLGRYNNSEKYLNVSLEKLGDFKSAEVYLLLAKINFQKKEYEKSFELFYKMLEIETIPQRLIKETKYAILNLLLFIDFKDEFVEILSKDFFDKDEDILRIADTFYMNERFEEALKLYILVIERFGVNENLLFKLGYISSKLRSLEQACYYFEKYLEKVPDNLDALNNLAFLYLNLEKIDQAEKTYKKILELNNYSFEANLHLAIIYMSQRNKKKASEHIENAKMLNPVSPHIINLYKIYKSEFL